jgi:hypothetical protein
MNYTVRELDKLLIAAQPVTGPINRAACLLSVEVTYGTESRPDWAGPRTDGWTVELTTDNGTESFEYWMGEGLGGREPEVWEVLHSLISDALFLSSEPEQFTIEQALLTLANERKCERLFGSYWFALCNMEEEELQAVFGSSEK